MKGSGTGTGVTDRDSDQKRQAAQHSLEHMNWTEYLYLSLLPGKPYFEACPQSREIYLAPDANGRAHLHVETARDGYGSRLPLISTTDIDNNRLSLEWSKGSRQTVILNAFDNWRQRATCQFQVLIIGEWWLGDHCPSMHLCINITLINKLSVQFSVDSRY